MKPPVAQHRRQNPYYTDRQKVEARREEFKREHAQKRRDEKGALLKKIDDYQFQIDELNKSIERDYHNDTQKHISLEQYRERCVSLPIRRTAAPDALHEYAQLRTEANCSFSPNALRSNQPNWLVEPLIEEYVPTPIIRPTLLQLPSWRSHEPINFLTSRPSVQGAHNTVSNLTSETVNSRHCEHSLRATSSVQIVSQDGPNHSIHSQLVTHPQSARSKDKLAISKPSSSSGKSHVGSVYSRLGEPVEYKQSVQSNDLITISRTEYEQLVANPQPKKKKLGKSQRLRIRKAKERDQLLDLYDNKDH